MEEKKYTTDDLDVNGILPIEGTVLTQYSNLKNCYIKKEYTCNSITGVIGKNKNGKFDICSPISLVSIQEDAEATYYEYNFIDRKGIVRTETFKGSEIGSATMVKILTNLGMDIIDEGQFKKFIKIMNKTNQDVKNNTIMNGFNCKWMEIKIGSTKYGWAFDGENYDFTSFIDKTKIITKMPNIDGPLFQKKGTKEGQLKVIENEINDFKEPKILKIALAAGLCGLLVPMLHIDTPFILFTGPTSSGKQNISDLLVGLYGKNHQKNTGLQRNSGDSLAARSRYRTHLGILPTVYDELQDLINKNKGKKITPSETVKALAYETTSGGNGARATGESDLQDIVNNSQSPMIGFCEGHQFKDLTDGGSSRIIIIDSELPDLKHFVKSENPSQYFKASTQNYGHIAPDFIKFLIDKALTEEFYVSDTFEKYKREAELYMGDKVASNAALLTLTYDLMVEAECLPAICKKANKDEWYRYISKFNNIVSSTELVFNTWANTVQDDISIVSKNRKLTETDYEDRAKNSASKVRGRIEILEGQNKAIVYMSRTVFRQQLEHIAEVDGITGFTFEETRLFNIGRILKPASNDPKHKYEFKMKDITNTGYSYVMKIMIDIPDDKTPEREAFEEHVKKVRDEKLIECKKKANEKTSIAANW